MTSTNSEASIMPVAYQGMFRMCIIAVPEYVRDDGKQDRYIAFLTVAQVLAGKAIHFAEQEDGHGVHQR